METKTVNLLVRGKLIGLLFAAALLASCGVSNVTIEGSFPTPNINFTNVFLPVIDNEYTSQSDIPSFVSSKMTIILGMISALTSYQDLF